MRVVNRNFPEAVEGRAQEWQLYLTGDWHLGTVHADRKALRETVREIERNPNARWVGMGDYADLVTFRDKRFDARVLDSDIWQKCGQNIAAYQDYVKADVWGFMAPIADKCLGLLEGNHETLAANRYHLELMTWLTVKASAEKPMPDFAALGSSACIRLKFCRGHHRLVIPLFVSHGSGGAVTVGGKLNKLQSVMAWFPDAMIYACGHFHDELVRSVPVFRVVESSRDPRIIACNKWVALVPSFMRTYHPEVSGYGEARLYPPSKIGALRFDIRPYARSAGSSEVSQPEIRLTLGGA